MQRMLLAALLGGATMPLMALAPADSTGRGLVEGHRLAAPVAAHENVLAHRRRPGVRIWTSSGELVRRGERVRVFYRTEQDAFVTIFRVDTDGRMRVLFPLHPFEDNFVRGGRTYTADVVGRDAFVVDDDPGVGYVFAVAADDPFIYDPIADGERWDFRLIGSDRVHGDPYEALEDVALRLLPPEYDAYDMHLLPYYVERRYDYPRFVCYDCHTYAPYAAWDPYGVYCRSYTLVVWRDPWYYYPSYWYPSRYYGGRVVYVRPGVAVREGRYVFKSRDASAPGVQYRDRRADEPAGRRPPERYVRGADVGGVGSIPVPATGRRVVPREAGNRSGETGRRSVERENENDRRGTDRDPPVVGGGDRRRVPTTTDRGGLTPGDRRPSTEEAGEVTPGTTMPRDMPEPGRRRAGSAAPATPREQDDRPRERRPETQGRDRSDERSAKPSTGATIPRGESPNRRGTAGESRPESRPEASRPASGPEASRPRETQRQPENRPQAAPSRPESRPESRPRETRSSGGTSSRPSGSTSPGLVRRRP